MKSCTRFRREAESQEEEEEEASMIGGDNDGADFPPFIATTLEGTREGAREGAQAGFREGMHVTVELSAEEKERRRKGKGIHIHEVHGPRIVERSIRPTDNSGSDSCYPLNQGAQIQSRPASSDDADSRAGPCKNLGLAIDRPILVSEGSKQDVDMGGEGGTEVGMGQLGEPKVRDMKIEESGKEGPSIQKEEGRVEEVMRINPGAEEMQSRRTRGRGEGEAKGKFLTNEGSRGSSLSVSPGFQRIQSSKLKNKPVVSSPFRKLKRGGFKFLKRSASSASSGLKSDPATKKNRRISVMPNQEIAEVASNVGVFKPLSDEQISRLKSLEKDRAST